jgi:hypothetical protein
MKVNNRFVILVLLFALLSPLFLKSQHCDSCKKNTISIVYGTYSFALDNNPYGILHAELNGWWFEYQRRISKYSLITKHSITKYSLSTHIDFFPYTVFFGGIYILQNNSLVYEFNIFKQLYIQTGIGVELRYGKEDEVKANGDVSNMSNLDIGIYHEIALKYSFLKRFCIFTDFKNAKHIVKTNPNYHIGNPHTCHYTWRIGLGFSF